MPYEIRYTTRYQRNGSSYVPTYVYTQRRHPTADELKKTGESLLYIFNEIWNCIYNICFKCGC